LWALRYPDTHDLYVLERQAGGQYGSRHLDHSGSHGRMRIHSEHLADHPGVVVASERMDDNPHWREMQPGELLHVGPDLRTTHRMILPDAPAHQLSLNDLRPDAAASQNPA
jgi:predicted glutamine amidotransferase